MSITRICLAFALAPVFPSLFFLTAFHLSDRAMIMKTLIFSIPFSYVPCFLFGIPLVSYLKKKQRLNAVNVVTSGAVLGTVVFYVFGIVFSVFLGSSKNVIPELAELVSGAILGVLVALPFSLIAGLPFGNAKQ